MITLQTAQQDSTAQQSLLFLQRLASDDNFRRELESNPASALAQFGLEVSELPESVTLPSQDTLNAGLEHLAFSDSPADPNRLQLAWQGYYQLPN